MPNARLILEPWRAEGDRVVVAARLESAAGSKRLWWSVPADLEPAVTSWADPFVVGLLFPMMTGRQDVRVEGKVSPSLLRNLEQYMGVWTRWEPDLYRPVKIEADEEVESPPPDEGGLTVMPFSCGVDSCFTALRHRRGLAGRRNRRVEAGIVINGFDIEPDEPNAAGMYDGLLNSARTLLEGLSMRCIPASSNFREIGGKWAHSHGTHLLSALRLLARRFDSAVIPNSLPYDRLDDHWGSHPMCDPLLGGRTFEVSDDGGEFGRVDKVRLLACWPAAMKHLRVCFDNPGSHLNCCRCEKCIRTMLAFRAAGLERPPAFAQDAPNRLISRAKLQYGIHMVLWVEVMTAVKKAGLDRTSWYRAMAAAVRRCRRRTFLKRLRRPFVPIRNAFRRVFRGSTLSRKERNRLR